MIFYTADQHFGYEDVIRTTSRPFASVKEMDEALINNWNRVVSDEDTVYLIGDLGGYCTPFPAQQLGRLRGHKHLIRGNHDTCIPNQQLLLDYFETVTDFLEIDDGDRHITMCHYPLVYIQGGCMIHGHLHNTKKEVHRILQELPRVLNAGVDLNNYRPVTLQQLIENNRIYYCDPERGKLKQRSGRPGCGQKWNAVFYPLPHRKD